MEENQGELTQLLARLSPIRCRYFAADCAASVLDLWEEAHEGDLRPRQAIQAARLFARKRLQRPELTQAGDDAWAAYLTIGIATADALAAQAAYFATVEDERFAAEHAARLACLACYEAKSRAIAGEGYVAQSIRAREAASARERQKQLEHLRRLVVPVKDGFSDT